MDKIKADDLMHDVSDAIAEVLAAHGMERTKTRGKYDSTTLTMTLTLTELAEDGAAVNENTVEARAFAALAGAAGIDPGLLGKTVVIGGSEFVVAGYNTRAPKNPIILKGVEDGKTYRSTLYSLKYAHEVVK